MGTDDVEQSVRNSLFRRPSRAEWRSVVAGGVLLALVPPAVFIPFFCAGGLPKDEFFRVVFPLFLLMGSALCGVFGAGGALLVVRMTKLVSQVNAHVADEYEKFARQVDGTFEQEGVTWRIEFAHNGRDAHLSTYEEPFGDGFITFTSLTVSRRSPDDFTCHVYPPAMRESLAKTLGLREVPVGHAEFDQAFVVKASNEYRIPQLLNRAACDRLLRVAEWSSGRPFPVWQRNQLRHVELHVEEQAIRICIGGGLESASRIAEFVDLPCQVVDAIEGV